MTEPNSSTGRAGGATTACKPQWTAATWARPVESGSWPGICRSAPRSPATSQPGCWRRETSCPASAMPPAGTRPPGSTIGRAYRHLADASVIEVADRRRARVRRRRAQSRPDGCSSSPPALRLAGSDDPGLDIVLRQTGAAVVTVGARGSFHGLTRIWRGTADAAAIHLRHRSGTHNSPFARTVLRGRPPDDYPSVAPRARPAHTRGQPRSPHRPRGPAHPARRPPPVRRWHPCAAGPAADRSRRSHPRR